MKYYINFQHVLEKCISEKPGEDVVVPSDVKVISNSAFWYTIKCRNIYLNEGLKKIDPRAFRLVDKNTEVHCPEPVFHLLPADVKVGVVLAKLDKYPSDGEPEAEITAYIKRMRKMIFKAILKQNDQTALGALLDICGPSLAAVEDYIDMANEGDHAGIMAYLLSYKNRSFSDKVLQAAEERRFERSIGLRDRTAAEWKKMFRCELHEDGYVITLYKGKEKDVVIPEMIGSRKVVGIGAQAFYRAPITSVVVPETVKKIGNSAFWHCYSLTEAVIPEHTELGQYVFEGCSNLVKEDR